MHTEQEIKRVGRSGQISLGKRFAGQYFREEKRDDGVILLVPIAVLPKSHWSIRDEPKIRRALAWAAESSPRESSLEELTARAKSTLRKKRGQ
jgi:hypothetical protein